MGKEKLLLAINIGSTSTKVAYFRDLRSVVQETMKYSAEELSRYPELRDELPRRYEDLLGFLKRNEIDPASLDIIISRGGLGKPGHAGAYGINETMCRDLMEGKYGKHPSALGPSMAYDLAKKYDKKAIIFDPPSTDEFQPIARVSGIPEIERKSAFHALNQKMAARKAASEIGKTYQTVNLVVAHLGGGITVGAHQNGFVIDCTHGLSEGPLTPERAGNLPTNDLVELACSGKMDKKQLLKRLVGQGGLDAYLGTADAQKIEAMIRQGDPKAEDIYRAMSYQIAKDIGAMSVVLRGGIEGIVLTGGLAFSEMLTGWIKEMVSFIAPVFIYPGEDEMIAMAEGAIRVLNGEERLREYK
jgi:butyrate kinase